jgi:hypothetical protein
VPKAPRLSLAWLITGILALQLAAWLGWFVLAAHHPVAEVPLATAGR